MPLIQKAPPRRRTIGVDLAISGAQVAQVFDDGKPVGKPVRFRLTSADLARFISVVLSGTDANTQLTAVMEPTGMSWFPVAAWLRRAGITVIRVKGQRVKALRKYLSEHAKTDSADATVLGLIPAFGDRGLDPLHVPAPDYHALQRFTKQRHRYQDLIASSRRRILDLIRWACPALEAVLPDTVTQLALAILSEYFSPEKVLACRRDVLGRFLARSASGSHPQSGPFIDELVVQLKAAAAETVALHGASVDFDALQFEVLQEVEHLRLWIRHVVELDREVEAIYRRVHPSDAIRSIPGIGSTLAPLLVAVLGQVNRFRNVDHIRGFCGMFPTKSASGGQEHPGQRLTKSGSDRIKRALYLASDTARKIDPDLAAVYWRLMVRKGHHHKQAICAVATRLVNRIFRVLKTGEPYVLRDESGNRLNVADAKRLVVERFSVPLEIRRVRRKTMVEAAA